MTTAPLPITDQRFYPSILQQTRWRCGFFYFGKALPPGCCFFNCGLVERPDGLWLIVRRARNERRSWIGFNDLAAVRLSEPAYQPQYLVPIIPHHYFDREHFEDPRAIYHQGVTYIAACNFVVTNNGHGWTGAHQTLNLVSSLESKTPWKVDRRIDPVYGFNGSRIGKDTGMEKNWLWFFHQDRLHLLYQTQPHQVVRWTDDFKPDLEFKTENPEKLPLPWDFGAIRGGTPPVLAPDGGEYVTFFHSSLETGDGYRRRYYMGAYAFEAQPPFAITRITTEPLLTGSWQDPWAPKKPLVVFPCGSRLRDGHWLVSFGVNDLASAWIEIPHKDLSARLVPLAQKSRLVRLLDNLK